jgi:transcriptional regulator
MYLPPHFAETDRDRIHDFIRAHAFGTLVSVINGAPIATLLPFTLVVEGNDDVGTLYGHVARANPHATTFDGLHDAIALFYGPHAYVSPGWYEAPVAVPTWNYTAVEASGRPERVDDRDRVRGVLDALAATYEAGRPNPWTMDAMPAEFTGKMMGGIVAFAMPIRQLTGKLKMSQNRSSADRAGVRAGLVTSGRPEDVATARMMDDLEARRG